MLKLNILDPVEEHDIAKVRLSYEFSDYFIKGFKENGRSLMNLYKQIGQNMKK